MARSSGSGNSWQANGWVNYHDDTWKQNRSSGDGSNTAEAWSRSGGDWEEKGWVSRRDWSEHGWKKKVGQKKDGSPVADKSGEAPVSAGQGQSGEGTPAVAGAEPAAVAGSRVAGRGGEAPVSAGQGQSGEGTPAVAGAEPPAVYRMEFFRGWRPFTGGYKQHNAALKWFRKLYEDEDNP